MGRQPLPPVATKQLHYHVISLFLLLFSKYKLQAALQATSAAAVRPGVAAKKTLKSHVLLR